VKKILNYLKDNKIVIIQTIILIGIFSIFVWVTSANYVKPIQLRDNDDISYEFDQANQILDGSNPYERVLKGNLLVNKKYATLFPLYYYFLATVSNFSNQIFKDFIKNYWYIIQAVHFLTAYLIFLYFRRENKGWLGLLAVAVFLLNRWTVNNTMVLKQDVISVMFLLLAVYILPKFPRLSFLTYGISIGIKHLSIFAFPIFVLYILKMKLKIKQVLILVAIFLIPIIIPSLPFLYSNPKAFFYSLMFSTTRAPISVGTTNFTGFEKLLVNYNNLGSTFAAFYLLLPRLPLLVLIFSSVILVFTKKIKFMAYLPVVYLIFTGLNPVYFVQYSMWITPFILFPNLEDYVFKKTD